MHLRILNYTFRRSVFRMWMLMLGSVVAVSVGPAEVAQAQPVSGPVVGSDTSTIPGGHGKPNQSRAWYNSQQDRWDALVPKDDGGPSGSDHYILKAVDEAAPAGQLFTLLELEDRNTARTDIFWDDTNKKLYVLGSHATSSQFWRVGWDENTDSYSLEVGIAGTGVEVSGIKHANPNRPASIYVSPNGGVWVAVMKNGALDVQHSVDGGATWMAFRIRLNTSVIVGVTTWIHFEEQGTTSVGLFAAENGEDGISDYFYYYIDQDADPSVLANWINDSSNIPAPVGLEGADDHVSAARDGNENQYFAVKTDLGAPTDPLIKLYKRTAGGTWSQFKVTEVQEVPEKTRPSIVIDEVNAEIYVYMSDTAGGDGNRVKARLDSLEDLATALFTLVFSEVDGDFDNLMTPRQSVDSASGIVVLAHNTTEETVWFGAEEVPPCVLSQGFWKNHPEDWPVSDLELGTVLYDQSQLLQILREKVKGNGLVSLAKQLIAAKLNIASGSLVPPGVQDAIDSADAQIDGLVIPPIGGGSLRPNITGPNREILADYNNGLSDGPASCGVDEGSVSVSSCPCDVDGDGMVAVPDLLALLAAWGSNPMHPADFDLDGTVAVPDLLTLLAAWGPCP